MISILISTPLSHRFHKMVFKMERGLPPNKIVPKFRNIVDEYRNLMPVVQALRNRALKERHWGKIFDVVGQQISRDNTFTLQILLNAKVQEWKDEISQVSTEATQELALEELLAKVHNKWGDVEFVVMPYKEVKDTFILGGIEEVQVRQSPGSGCPYQSTLPVVSLTHSLTHSI